MKRFLVAFVALTSPGVLTAQDLGPGVLLLSRVKRDLTEEFQRLTSVSCVETIQRQVAEPRRKLKPLDTVRLEVLTTGDKELYASPTERKFSEKHPLSFAGAGMLSNGLFGPQLKSILLNGNAQIVYKGETDVGGRHLARYDYRLSVLFSGQTIEMVEGSGKVGLGGSFWLDPQTYDVVRLEWKAEDIPPSLPVSEATTAIDYDRMYVGGSLAVLLPKAAEVMLNKSSGETSLNRIDFTHCRLFGSESKVDFEANDLVPTFATSTVDDTLRLLPAGLQIRVTLQSRIRADTTVGSIIKGIVPTDVVANHAVVIPAGSPVRGRLRRLEYYIDPSPYYVVGLEFTEIEIEGIRHLFFANWVDAGTVQGVEPQLRFSNGVERTMRGDMLQTTQRSESVFAHDLPGVATFFLRGQKLAVPPAFTTTWKTRLLKP